MAPAQSSSRRGAQSQSTNDQVPQRDVALNDLNVNPELFIDPMLGTPLSIYIEKDVEDKDELVRLVTAYGGAVSPGYSGVTYILVDRHKISGQNLYRQYAGKKTKIVLDARWIQECIRTNQLQTFSTQWAGCKVTGDEQVHPVTAPRVQDEPSAPTQPVQAQQPSQPLPQASTSQVRDHPQPQPPPQPQHPPPPTMPYPMAPMTTVMVDPMNGFSHTIYAHPMHPPHMPPSGPWPHAHIQAPLPPHMIRPPHGQPYRDDQHWDYSQHQDASMTANQNYGGEYRYRENHPPWLPATTNGYYDPTPYDQAYAPAPYMPEPTPAAEQQVPMTVDETPAPLQRQQTPMAQPQTPGVGASLGTLVPPDQTRGRKRTRGSSRQLPATPATELVNRSTPARSPTPPTRVIKSTFGGNLFTADDILYLKKYIDYCQEQGLVLSLREICERVAVKAPHHTFYSWRRYCNKHQIKLGGYVMNAAARSTSPAGVGDQEMNLDIDEEESSTTILQGGGPGPSTSASRLNAAVHAQRAESSPRNRSPSPPKALFRSTTGKGVAFTQEDIDFMMKFLRYRESQGRVDMVQFWKDVAAKAPHHSRASWMKFWRRHKHELLVPEGEEYVPPPAPPEKKKRYSREDDILLAKFQFEKPEGTSDKLFQAFARLHPHHPWKGWQEHHRLHKAKIDHLVEMLRMGQNIDAEE